MNENYIANQNLLVLDELPFYIVKLDLDFNIMWANKYALANNKKLLKYKCYSSFNPDKEQCTFCPIGRAISSKVVEISKIKKNIDQEEKIFKVTAIPLFNKENEIEGVFEIQQDITYKLKYIKNNLSNHSIKNIDILNIYNLVGNSAIKLKNIVFDSIELTDKIVSNEFDNLNKRDLICLKSYLNKMLTIVSDVTTMREIAKKNYKKRKVKTNLEHILINKIKDYQIKANLKGNRFECEFDSKIPNKLILEKSKFEMLLNSSIAFASNNSSNKKLNLVVTLLAETKNISKIGLQIKNIGSSEIYDFEDNFNSKLSLAIVKSLVEELNGKLNIINVNRYIINIEIIMSFKKTFLNSIKLNKTFKIDVIKENIKIKKKSYKILVVDDEIGVRMFYDNILSKKYDIIFATNGKDAIEKYSSELPDLVFMDIMMPLMNGFETYDYIEKNNINCVPIIACSYKVINSEKNYLKSYGFDDYLEKPIKIKKILEITNKYLNER